jgi:hypothetical protein
MHFYFKLILNFVYLISPPFDINKKIYQKLPLKRCSPFKINGSESLLNGILGQWGNQSGKDMSETPIFCALSLLSQIIITGLGIEARRIHDDKEEEKDVSS